MKYFPKLISVFLIVLIHSLAVAQHHSFSNEQHLPTYSSSSSHTDSFSDWYSNKSTPELKVSRDTVPSNDSLGYVVPGGYIEKMDNYLIARVSLVNDNERFSVDQGNQDFQIYPNGASKLKFNLNYRFLSVGFNVIPKFISSNDDDRLKGETSGFGLNTGFNFKNWFQLFSFSQTRGYYLENTSDFDPFWQDGDPYSQFPQLRYRNFQGITGYSLNPNFSTKSLMTGTERQLKSVGSFMPMLLYRYYMVDNREEITDLRSTQKTNNFEILAGAGYYYNYIFKQDFYISGGGNLGYGLLATKLTTRSIDDQVITHQSNGIFRYELRAATGYNSERIFGGFVFTTENSRFRQENTPVINANWRVFTQFFVGYRFVAPKKLRDNLNKIVPGG